MRAERLAASRQAPMLQEPVHVDDGEQRTGDPTLGCATRVAPAAAHAPFPVAIPVLDRHLQPQLDQPQHIAVDDTAGHRSQEVRVRDRVEILRQVGVDDVGIAPA